MDEKALPRPTPQLQAELQSISPELWQFIAALYNSVPKVQTFTPTLNPSSLSGNTEQTETFTVEGLRVEDVVVVNKPTRTTDYSVVDAHVSADDTLSLTFANVSGGSIDPPAEEYRIVAIRL